MATRKPTAKPKVDQLIFKHTATRTKRVNVEPTQMRGGTRL